MSSASSPVNQTPVDVSLGRKPGVWRLASRSRQQAGRPLPHGRGSPRAILRTAVLSAAMAVGATLLAPANLLPHLQAAEPLSPNDQGDLLLNAARRAYNDRNYNQAVT